MKSLLVKVLVLFTIITSISCSSEDKKAELENGDDSGGKGGSSVSVSGPSISFIYLDKKGETLVDKFVLNLSGAHIVIKDKDIFEIISVTDQHGDQYDIEIIILGRNKTVLSFSIPDTHDLSTPKTVKEYTIKYKVPILFGKEHIEELKVVFNVDGMKSGFKEDVWYNKKKLTGSAEDVNIYREGDMIQLTFSVDK